MSCKLCRTIEVIVAIALVMAILWCPIGAMASEGYGVEVEQVLLSSDLGSCHSVQHLLDTTLTNMAGKGAEFIVLSIRQYEQSYNFDAYLNALDKYLEETKNLPATTMQKIALVQYVCGGISKEEVFEVARETEGKQGIMSIVFALHIYSNLGEQADVSRCVDSLLSQQGSTGGWGLNPEASTVDITAMTIQALAPYYQEQKVQDAVNKALDYLRNSQQSSGSFLSYGVENCESVAQVIVALTTLGLDYKTELKGDFGSLAEVLNTYKLSTGGYVHMEGGQLNMTATAQAIMALVAMDMADSGAGSIYTFDEYEFGSGQLVEGVPEDIVDIKKIQIVVAGVVFVAFAIYLTFGCVKKRFSPMDIITISLVGLVSSGFIFFSRIETPDQFYSYNLPEITDESLTVSMSIMDGDKAIIGMQEYALLEGDTVFELVYRATRSKGIPMSYVSGWDAYISSIGDLAEGDRGATSGWVYYVNGVQPQVGVDNYQLKAGDVVELRYVESYGGQSND
ncbi:MAG: DUF4430 domain-containing protein [Clostridia bacterium]|nr:DUF4430 domain-containing protein [Clostridia bacterium]